MKKILSILVLTFLVFTTNVFTAPFISTKPSLRVEFFQVTVENNETKESYNKILQPQQDDSLIADVINDLEVKSETSSFKITIVASNSDGDSEETSFNLIITEQNGVVNFKIEPIPEENNPDYLEKYIVEQLEVDVKPNQPDDGGGGGKGCFITTIVN